MAARFLQMSFTDRLRNIASPVCAPWILVVVGAAVYANSLNGPFIYDDESYIVQNEGIRQLWPPVWLEHRMGNRPVAALTLAVNYSLGDLDVIGYHVANIAIHLLCALAAMAVVRSTLRRMGGGFSETADVLALIITLLWMVHPLVSECVNYITQRTESLMGLFSLLTLYCVSSGIEGRSARWSGGAVLCCALGMACKESMVSAPLMVLLYDRTFAAGSYAVALRRRPWMYCGLAATWLVLAWGLWARPHGDTIGLDLRIGAWTYALNQCQMLWTYLHRVLWPHPLILDYGFARELSLADVWVEGTAVLALVVLTLTALRRWPPWGFAGAWFFLILAPTSSFVPILTEVGAERRMYLPLLGPIAMMTIAAYWALNNAHLGRYSSRLQPRLTAGTGGALVVLAAVGLGWTTVQRNGDYSSAASIWGTVVAAAPQSGRGHNNLGVALEREGSTDKALHHYRRALEINPGYADAHRNLGTLLGSLGQREAAIDHLRRAVEIQPLYADTHNNLGIALGLQGEVEEAIDHYQRALDIEPDLAQAHYNLGNALASQQRFEDAVSHYRRALQLKPDFTKARQNLEVVLGLLHLR